jgi:hypothetical protein
MQHLFKPWYLKYKCNIYFKLLLSSPLLQAHSVQNMELYSSVEQTTTILKILAYTAT